MIKRYFNELLTKIKEYYIGYRIKRLIKKADKYREISGSQIFVVKIEGKIKMISKRWFKEQRQKGKFPKTMTTDYLKKISFYYTRA